VRGNRHRWSLRHRKGGRAGDRVWGDGHGQRQSRVGYARSHARRTVGGGVFHHGIVVMFACDVCAVCLWLRPFAVVVVVVSITISSPFPLWFAGLGTPASSSLLSKSEKKSS